MKTEFKDVAHLYLGCELTDPTKIIGAKIQTVNSEMGAYYETTNSVGKLEGSTLRPILRPLWDMTDEERNEFDGTMKIVQATPVHRIGVKVWTSISFAFLLSKHFDLFDLIESGQAIDKTKV